MEPGRQLAMFMTPKEIKSGFTPNDGASDESNARVWGRKLRESKKVPSGGGIPVQRSPGQYETLSLHDHIAEKGVSKAVYIGARDPKVYDGHHRVAAANASRPDDLIPVLHADSPEDAFAHRGSQQKAETRQRRAARRG